MSSRESDLLHWLYALSLDDSMSAEQFRRNAHGALAEFYAKLTSPSRQRTRPMREPTPVFTNRLQCVEFGRLSLEGERGWTARLTVDDEVVVYCPECDESEFGDRT